MFIKRNGVYTRCFVYILVYFRALGKENRRLQEETENKLTLFITVHIIGTITEVSPLSEPLTFLYGSSLTDSV